MSPITFPDVASLHHFAYRCRDAEETRHFYEAVPRLLLTVAVARDRLPTTGEQFHGHYGSPAP